MPLLTIVLSLLIAPVSTDSGFVTVRSNMPGISLYLEGDYIGRAPLDMHKVRAGDYSLSIASNDSLENVYWRIRTGGIGEKLSATWTLVAINAGTHSVTVKPRAVTEVFIDYGRVTNAPNEAKVLACCGLGGLVGIGMVVGFLVHLLFFRNA